MSINSAIKKFFRTRKIKSTLKRSSVNAITDLELFHIYRNPESLAIFDKLKPAFVKSNNYILSAVGERYISVIVSEHNHNYLIKSFGSHIFSIEKKIACINIKCSQTDKMAGVITYITSVLSEKDINMYGFFTSQDDIVIAIDEEHAFEYVSYLKKVFEG